jgi:DnaJ-class molecular chaperone
VKKRELFDKYGEDGLKFGGPPPPPDSGCPGGFQGFNGFSGFGGGDGDGGGGGGGGGGQRYEFTQEQAEALFRNLFGGRGGRSPFGNNFSFAGDDTVFGEFPEMGGFSGCGHRAGDSRRRDPPKTIVQIDLPCTLEQLNHCVTRKMKIHRNVEGHDEDKMLLVDLHPWWKTGTKITFEGEGDKQIGESAQDLQFVIRVVPHGTFENEEGNLVCERVIPLREALGGYELKITDLDGHEHRQLFDEVINPGREYRIKDAGMFRKDGTRGDIIVRFRVRFPLKLNADVRAQIRRIIPAN